MIQHSLITEGSSDYHLNTQILDHHLNTNEITIQQPDLSSIQNVIVLYVYIFLFQYLCPKIRFYWLNFLGNK